MNEVMKRIEHCFRSRSLIARISVSLLVLGLILAWVFEGYGEKSIRTLRDQIMDATFESTEDEYVEHVLRLLDSSLQREESDAWAYLDLMPVLARTFERAYWDALVKLMRGHLGNEIADLALDYLDASLDGHSDARNRIRDKAEAVPPQRYANRILANLALLEGRKLEAARRFRNEGAFADAEEERLAALRLLRELERFEELQEVLSHPDFQSTPSPRIRRDLAAHSGDWFRVFHYQLLAQVTSIKPAFALLAAFGGLVWAIILVQLLQLRNRKLGSLGLCVAAFALGVFSTVLTVFLSKVFETVFSFTQNGDFLHDVGYFIASVGLREELCKLVALLPLVPLLRRRGDELEMLLVSAFVGLGFAVEENVLYFERSLASDAMGRFLTANFFHMGLTGLCGLYLCRGIGIRGFSLSDFFSIFGLAILAHGLYDALIIVPELADFSLFAFSIFIVISLKFFAEAHHLRDASNVVFSITGVFAIGLSLFTAVVFVFIATRIGFRGMWDIMIPNLLGIAIITIMFFREFRESLYE